MCPKNLQRKTSSNLAYRNRFFCHSIIDFWVRIRFFGQVIFDFVPKFDFEKVSEIDFLYTLPNSNFAFKLQIRFFSKTQNLEFYTLKHSARSVFSAQMKVYFSHESQASGRPKWFSPRSTVLEYSETTKFVLFWQNLHEF